ncbi:transporter substrate-binding domain-containing protein [Novosphingobium sp. YJ-S2-02]|uniref:Transporter substrate-binding domain-containing protein n=1 Tax=Novosphingobium aureum TaxID=2792964 RepID=A0A931MKB7_9SPHN|nr:transporter substrate-binding domain-containing protein [Novosphingobium aureum]
MEGSRRTLLKGLFAAAGALAVPAALRPSPLLAAPLDKVRETGVLRVGLYTDNRPWSWEQDGKPVGIDADLARALAQALGVRADIALFIADEELSDDLRNVVWRGGLLGFQPCDVMLHVPFDRALMQQEDNVVFLAPYYRESFGAACSPDAGNCEVVPAQFKGHAVAAELDSIPDFYLLGHAGGVLAKDVVHKRTGYDAIAALGTGEAEFAVASRAQIEAAMADAPTSGIRKRHGPLPMMLSPGWDIGIAVKENSRSLGFALEEEMDAMMHDGRMTALFARHGVAWQPALASQPTA